MITWPKDDTLAIFATGLSVSLGLKCLYFITSTLSTSKTPSST